ncbi:MAG: hypothetical protein AAFX94_06840 [Myxococcota bacterium]
MKGLRSGDSELCTGNLTCSVSTDLLVMDVRREDGQLADPPEFGTPRTSYSYQNPSHFRGAGLTAFGTVVARRDTVTEVSKYGSLFDAGATISGILIETLRVDTLASGEKLYDQTVFTPSVRSGASTRHRFVYTASTLRTAGALTGNPMYEPTLTPWVERTSTTTGIDPDGNVTGQRSTSRMLAAGIGELPSQVSGEFSTSESTETASVTFLQGTRERFEGRAASSTVVASTARCVDETSSCERGAALTTFFELRWDPETGALAEVELEPGSGDFGRSRLQTFSYDGYGNVVSAADIGWAGEEGTQHRRTETRFDSQEHMFPVSAQNAAGHQSAIVYWQATGTPLFSRDANGLWTTYLRDAFGAVVGVRSPTGFEGSETLRAPVSGDPDGTALVVESRSNTGEYSWRSVDVLGRAFHTERSTPFGTRVERTGYDWLGRQVERSVPHYAGEQFVSLRTVFDGTLTRPLSVEARNGTTSFVYHGLNGWTSTDPAGNTSASYANADGTHEVTVDAINQLNHIHTSPGGALMDVFVGTKNTLRNVLDPRGRLLSTVSPDRGERQQQFNSFDEVVRATDALGETETVILDLLGRETKRIHRRPDGVERHAITTWDGAAGAGVGQMSVTRSFDGHAHYYEYTDRGQLSKVRQQLQGFTDSPWEFAEFKYDYDATGRLVDTTYPQLDPSIAPTTVRTGYTDDVVTSLFHASSGHMFWQKEDENADGHTTLTRYGDGTTIARAFDPVTGWLQSVDTRSAGNTPLYWMEIEGRDPVGNVTVRV